MINKKNIDFYLLKYVLNETSEDEKLKIEDWINSDLNNLHYFSNFQKLHQKFQLGVTHKYIVTSFPVFEKRLKKKKNLKVFYKIAASFIIGILTLFILEKFSTLNNKIEIVDIRPEKNKAILYTGSGDAIKMDDFSDIIKDIDGTIISRNNIGELIYESNDENDPLANIYNKIIVPRGGELTITLSDGTKVWLNAETEISYPTSFFNKNREVHLKGEAYFKVVNNEKPFMVHTDNSYVLVHGTEFNIHTYNDYSVETVLIQGSVSIHINNEHYFLKPHQKAIYDNEKLLDIIEVDILPYTGWKDGYLIFKNEHLGSIMDKLARWYDLEIIYENEDLKNIRLSGNLQKYEDFKDLLYSFERITNKVFDIKNNVIIIKDE